MKRVVAAVVTMATALVVLVGVAVVPAHAALPKFAYNGHYAGPCGLPSTYNKCGRYVAGDMITVTYPGGSFNANESILKIAYRALRLSKSDQYVSTALFEALYVESSFRNYCYGTVPSSCKYPNDGHRGMDTSLGPLQQLYGQSYGWAPGGPEGVKALMTPQRAISLFVGDANAKERERRSSVPGITPGGFAQYLQKSGYAGKYDSHHTQAIAAYKMAKKLSR